MKEIKTRALPDTTSPQWDQVRSLGVRVVNLCAASSRMSTS